MTLDATPPPDSFAGVNTHDTPTFTAFWEGRDLDLQLELGLLSAEEADGAREKRSVVREKITSAFGVEAESEAALAAILNFPRLVRGPHRLSQPGRLVARN